MIVADANLLLYAYNPSAAQHEKAKRWLEQTIAGPEMLGLPWVTILAFLRIGTNPRAFPNPLTIAEAVSIVAEWFEQPGVRVMKFAEAPWTALSPLLIRAQIKGPLVTDAHLAALAIEHGATLCSSDGDFSRFPALRWSNPLAS